MSFFFVCWHSRKWWPPIRGGTLQLALLRLENVKWTDYFCIKSISYTNCQWQGKKQHKKQAKPLLKPVFFMPVSKFLKWGIPQNRNFQIEGSLKIEISKMRDPSKWKFLKRGIRNVGSIPHFGNFYFEGSLVLEISILRDPSFQEFWDRYETNRFFGGLTQFFVLIFPSRQSSCTWHGYFKKTWVLARFFWLQGPLMQSSAAPQGSPPPTQQIKIQMQKSWVGWSTRRYLTSRCFSCSWHSAAAALESEQCCGWQSQVC